MKTFLNIFFSLILMFSSCNKNKLSILTALQGQNGLSYNESLHKWSNLKKLNGNSYLYQTTFVSWAGFGHTTEVKVVEGKVVARIYQGFRIEEQTGERKITDSYTEDEQTLGSQQKGASPLTIDELYHSCASNYLIADVENSSLYFESEINGIMTLCGFVPNGCADDCFQGISIDSFEWID